MTDVSLFQVGNIVEFEYPRHNFFGVLTSFEKRRVRVTGLRDTARSPIEPETVALQPLLLRGRFLMTGEDLDKQSERSFYVERMRSPSIS